MMHSSTTDRLQLMAWTTAGDLVLNQPVECRTLAISGRRDSDIHLPELGDSSVFIRITATGGTLFYYSTDGAEKQALLKIGIPVSAGPLTWLLTREGTGDDTDEEETHHRPRRSSNIEAPQYAALLGQLAHWLALPMTGSGELRQGLTEFLTLVVESTPAINGMLVVADGGGYSLVSAYGLSSKDAHKLWEKMPHSLAEEVLRTKAKVLLPDELRRQSSDDTTVFVQGVRSVAGFPVLAEDKLVAIFYLGFDNLLKRLSPELQGALEAAACLLGVVIQRAMLREQLESTRLTAETRAGDLPAGRLMIGTSPKLVEVYDLIGKLAPVDVPTLITGETGTGKELAARELHRLSPRVKKPFVVVNAAALPANLIESELFGHKKGAFTGALTDRVGLVERADGGTLFIDEIGELSLEVQAKLLRVLQEHAVLRLGETTPRDVDFRLVTATHRSLAEMVATAAFRDDLYYRIAGAVIHMPALRERADDIVTLANYFRRQFAERHHLPDKEWSAEALVALEQNFWRGNVRELENVVARAFVMAEGTVIRLRDLGFASALTDGVAELQEMPLGTARDQWMKNYLVRALKRHQGKRAETAKALGIGERTLFRYLEQFDIREL
jgi:transcriptional regulator with GAF, ATPase, and Fis domain